MLFSHTVPKYGHSSYETQDIYTYTHLTSTCDVQAIYETIVFDHGLETSGITKAIPETSEINNQISFCQNADTKEV